MAIPPEIEIQVEAQLVLLAENLSAALKPGHWWAILDWRAWDKAGQPWQLLDTLREALESRDA